MVDILSLKEEYQKLSAKIDKIYQSGSYNTDDLLKEQLEAMEKYCDTLEKIIEKYPLILDSFDKFSPIPSDKISVQDKIDEAITTMKERGTDSIVSRDAHLLIAVFDDSTETTERYQVVIGNGYLERFYLKNSSEDKDESESEDEDKLPWE